MVHTGSLRSRGIKEPVATAVNQEGANRDFLVGIKILII